MNEPRILLADASCDFTHKMSETIRASGDLRLCGVVSDGSSVVERVLTDKPTVLLLELMLPGFDGISIVRKLRDAKAQGKVQRLPIIIILSAIISDANTYLLREAGIDYYMVKPVVPYAVLERVRDLLQIQKETALPDLSGSGIVIPGLTVAESDDIDCDLTTLLIDMGIPASLSGYTYLREAIHLVIDMGASPDGVLSKRVYPEIAKKYGKSMASVEKAIRTAIETAWIRGRTDILDKMFGYTVSAQRGKPTNAEFIAMIADRYMVYGKVK
ncbi:MAG: sporulation transcription factor Spo0A [Clostridia bacterium]|nr:sporulation transcription factor Spo0A [Clostridia bacterium]